MHIFKVRVVKEMEIEAQTKKDAVMKARRIFATKSVVPINVPLGSSTHRTKRIFRG